MKSLSLPGRSVRRHTAGISPYGRWCFSINFDKSKFIMKSLSLPGRKQSSLLAHPDIIKNNLYEVIFNNVGVPGIEPGPYVPKTYILPIYYTPI